jgi:hypothetical protein
LTNTGPAIPVAPLIPKPGASETTVPVLTKRDTSMYCDHPVVLSVNVPELTKVVASENVALSSWSHRNVPALPASAAATDPPVTLRDQCLAITPWRSAESVMSMDPCDVGGSPVPNLIVGAPSPRY